MYRCLGVAVALLFAVPAVAASAPEGWGPAKLRMRVEDVRKAYPDLAPAPHISSPAFFTHPSMARYVVMQTRVPELQEPIDVEFRFWDGQLWTIIVYYGKNTTASVTSYLTKLHGPPHGIGSNPAWLGPRSKLVLSIRAQWFSITDTDLGYDAQKAFMEMQDTGPTPAGRTPGAAEMPRPAMTPP